MAALLTELRLIVEGDEFRTVVGDAVDASLVRRLAFVKLYYIVMLKLKAKVAH